MSAVLLAVGGSQPAGPAAHAVRLGNHVTLRCADAEIVLAHMRQGSVRVEPGDLGAVGAPLISSVPLGLRFEGRMLVRGDRLKGPGD